MKRIDAVTASLLVIGPIVLYPIFQDDISGYFASCFLYAVSIAVGKVVISDLGVDE